VTSYGLDSLGLNPGEMRFSLPLQNGPGAQPTSCTIGTWSFPGAKQSGHGSDHPPPSSTEVEEWAELYLYSHFVPSQHVIG